MIDIPIVGVVGLIALTYKAIDFVRLLANFQKEKSGVVTQVLSWVGGIAAVMLYANSDYADTVVIGEKNLSAVGGVSLVLLGIVLGSMASAAVDLKQAIDTTDSASKPKLFNETDHQ